MSSNEHIKETVPCPLLLLEVQVLKLHAHTYNMHTIISFIPLELCVYTA